MSAKLIAERLKNTNVKPLYWGQIALRGDGDVEGKVYRIWKKGI